MKASTYDYVASPYSHSSPLIREERYICACHYIADCLKRGEWVYSPIVHCHEIAKTWEMPKDADFWHSYNVAMLSGAARLRVLRLDGWDVSDGVKREIEVASKLGIPYILI